MNRLFYLCAACMLFSVSSVFAQKQVDFTSHKDGQVVRSRLIRELKGTANNVPDDGHVWILVQSEGFNGWYPQGGGERKRPVQVLQEKWTWTCEVYLGEEPDSYKGKYEIAIVVVNDEVHRELQGYVQKANQGIYIPIDFPKVIGDDYQKSIMVDRQ